MSKPRVTRRPRRLYFACLAWYPRGVISDKKRFFEPTLGGPTCWLGVWRLEEPPDAADCRAQEKPDRAVQGPRGRYRITRGPDRAPHRAHRQSDGALQAAHEGSS